MAPSLKTGFSLMPTDDFYSVLLNLLDSGKVDVVEWSFDMSWDTTTPDWCESILAEFGKRESLLGHGVRFSPLSGKRSARQERWLQLLEKDCRHHKYLHVSEHFGFFEAGSYADGAPLPLPMNDGSIGAGRSSLQALRDVCKTQVGLENLAMAFSVNDVRQQGDFLEALLEPLDAFLILDLHNLFCQSVNFDIPAAELMNSYPLHRVKEIHISGGSWSSSNTGQRKHVRRDTHDGPVPDEVFGLVSVARAKCPQLEFAILERLGNTMDDPADQSQYMDDFHRLWSLMNE